MNEAIDVVYDGFKHGKIELAQSYDIVQEYEDDYPTGFNPDDYIIVSKRLLSLLQEDSDWLACLEDAGLDDWEGISRAHDLMEKL